MIENKQFYINGQWVDPIDGKDHHVISPASEEPVAVISLGGAADADAAAGYAAAGQYAVTAVGSADGDAED